MIPQPGYKRRPQIRAREMRMNIGFDELQKILEKKVSNGEDEKNVDHVSVQNQRKRRK